MTKPFDPTKPVQLRDGSPARIIAVDINHSVYPIVAAYTSEHGEEICEMFTSEGNYYAGGEDNMDLVNVPEVPVVVATTYTNVYDTGEFGFSKSHINELPSNNGITGVVKGVVKVDVYSDGSFTIEKVNA